MVFWCFQGVSNYHHRNVYKGIHLQFRILRFHSDDNLFRNRPIIIWLINRDKSEYVNLVISTLSLAEYQIQKKRFNHSLNIQMLILSHHFVFFSPSMQVFFTSILFEISGNLWWNFMFSAEGHSNSEVVYCRLTKSKLS